MFDTLSNGQLETLLEQFTVPMFIIERHHSDTDFQMVGMNTALERLSDQPRDSIVGRSVFDMALTGGATDAGVHYLKCATTRSVVNFSYLLKRPDGEARCDVTLQYGQSPEGNDRIIATVIHMMLQGPELQDKIAFDDVSYFSSIADLQLENLSCAFSNASIDAQVTMIEEERIMRLHAVCRTIQRSVSDIKDIVRRAQERHSSHLRAPPQDFLPNAGETNCMDTVRALSDAWVRQ